MNSKWDWSVLDIELVKQYNDGKLEEFLVLHNMSFITVYWRLRKLGIKKRNIRGSNSISWKGGKFIDFNGYVRIYQNPKKYVYEHRLIMERKLGRKLGRKLKDYEVVHHKNEIRDDNNENNLEIMVDSEHNSMHNKGKGKGWCVYFDSSRSKKWQVMVKNNIGKQRYYGRYNSKEEAMKILEVVLKRS